MSVDITVQFARIIDADNLYDRGDHPFQLWRGAARFLPGRDGADVFIDHDHDRPAVGHVSSLLALPSGPGFRETWQCATATVTDPPAWLKRGTPVSVGHKRAGTIDDRILTTYVTEISLLSPGVKPNVPGAKVLLVEPTKAEVPPKTSSVAGRVSTPARLATDSVAARHAATRRTSNGVSLPASERYLTEPELWSLVEIAKTFDVAELARLLMTSGEASSPDPYLGTSPYFKAAA